VDIAYLNGSITYSGSGWLYKQSGVTYIVTAAHVGRVRDAKGSNASRYSDTIYATLYNETASAHQTYQCNVIGADARADIMLLRPVESGAFVNVSNAGLTFASSRATSPGDDCFIVGNPSGFDVLSISHGNVRDPKHVNQYNVETMFVTAPSIGGNSGGCIVDRSGNVIGLLTFGLTNTETMGGGASEFMLQPIVKKIIVNGPSSVGGTPWENNLEFAASSTSKPKAALQVTSTLVTTANILSTHTIMRGGSAAAHGGVVVSSPPANSKLQAGDVLVQIKYTPNDAALDPNYTGSEVTIPIGQWGGYSPTTATWFIGESNVATVKLVVVRNNVLQSEIQLTSADWGSDKTFYYMSEANDRELQSTLNTSYPI
jgi:S1-C subfamily serine protease